MKYLAARDKFSSGDLLVLTHKDWKSLYDLQVQAVRISGSTEYCHVGLIWVFGGRVWVIEAVTPKVRLVPLSHYAKEGFFWLPLNTPMTDEEVEFTLGQVGIGVYSKWQAIKAWFRRLKLGIDSFWQCAELVIVCRRMSGLDLGDVATPNEVVQTALDRLETSVFWVKD